MLSLKNPKARGMLVEIKVRLDYTYMETEGIRSPLRREKELASAMWQSTLMFAIDQNLNRQAAHAGEDAKPLLRRLRKCSRP